MIVDYITQYPMATCCNTFNMHLTCLVLFSACCKHITLPIASYLNQYIVLFNNSPHNKPYSYH